MASIGTLDKKYVSALTLMDKRDIDGRVIDASGEVGFLDYMKLMGRTLGAKQAWFYQHVNRDLIKPGVSTATVTGSGTATLGIPLTAGTSGQFRVGHVVKLRNKNALITAISTTLGIDTLTCVSVDGSNITFTAGDLVTFVSYAAAEGSGSVATLRHGTDAFYNHIQILTDTYESTDISDLTLVEAPDGQTYFVRQYAEKIVMFKKAIGGMLIGGQISATRFSDANPALTGPNSRGVQTAMGLDQYVEQYGGQRALSTLGTVALTDMDTREDQMLAKKTPKKFLVTGSTRAMRPYSNFLLNLGSAGITSVRMNIDGRDVNLMVQSWTRPGGFTYEFMPCQTFDDPNMYPVNANATLIGKSLYFLPKDKVNTSTGGAAGTAERFRIRVLDSKGLLKVSGPNSKWEDMILETTHGGLAPIPTNGNRSRTTDWTAYMALECLGAQHFYREQTVGS
jgi:hypothetical protein